MTAITDITVGTDWTAINTAGRLPPYLWNASDEVIELGIPDTSQNLLNDGNMETIGVGEWAVGSGAPLSKKGDPYEGLQCLRITKDAATQDWTSQNVTDINKLYYVIGVARGDGTITPGVGNSTAYQWTGTISTAWQLFDFWWIDPTGSGLYLYAAAGGDAGNFVEFDAMIVYRAYTHSIPAAGPGRRVLPGMTVFAKCASGGKILQVLRGVRPVA